MVTSLKISSRRFILSGSNRFVELRCHLGEAVFQTWMNEVVRHFCANFVAGQGEFANDGEVSKRRARQSDFDNAKFRRVFRRSSSVSQNEPISLTEVSKGEANFIRSFDRDPADLGQCIGLPISREYGFPASILLLLSNSERPLGSAIDVWRCESQKPLSLIHI